MLPRKVAESLYWCGQYLRGRGGVSERLAYLEKTQWLTPAELSELQFRKLESMLIHAFDTVPYYRKKMKHHGFNPYKFDDVSSLRNLPLLTRHSLREDLDQLLSAEADKKTLQKNYSSGSTGARACFYQDRDFRIWMRAHQLRTYKWCANWKLGERFVLLWGSEVYWSLKGWKDCVDNFLSNRREFNTFQLTPALIKKFVEKLISFDPVLISSYTNAMQLIAREVERQNLKFRSLRAIQLTSEPVPPIFRERLQRIFNCEVYDKYGSRETNIVSHETSDHRGLAIQSENVFVEILDENNQPCPAGVDGRLVLTTLNNKSMPLIRYETSDLASFKKEADSTGLGLPLMSSVAGRLQDLIYTPNGAYIDSYFFSYLIMRFEEIDWFQVVQTTIDAIHLRIVAPNGIGPEAIAAIKERITHHCGYPFRLTIELLTSMPISKTGKFRLCVSELGTSQSFADAVAVQGNERRI